MDLQLLKDIVNLIFQLFKFPTIYKKAQYWFIYYFRSPINVILFGESGTGKSQLANCIIGSNNPSNKRTRITTKQTFVLPNGRRINIIDTPGHKTYTLQRQELCHKFIVKNKIKGIINIVSYGYHETDVADEVRIFKNNTSEVKEEYLRENRNREIAQVDEWINYLNNKNIRWIITIINKADIWYQNHSAVKDFYEKGEYGVKLNQISRLCPRHTFIYCSIIAPFYNKPMTIVFGEDKKMVINNDLMEFLIRLTKKNNG